MTAVRQLQCPSCGGSVEVKAAGYSVTVACRYCGSILDVSNPDVRLIEEYKQAVSNLEIPLGSRGIIDNVEWEAIGWQARSDDEAHWEEYLLFNPYAGYRWLVRADGEWQFGRMILDPPQLGNQMAEWRGRNYSQDYDPVTTTTNTVVGEFYWRVRRGDQVIAATFSRGDEVLSLERGGDEVNWTQLRSLGAADMRRTFGVGLPAGPRTFGRRRVEPEPPPRPKGFAGQLWSTYADAPAADLYDLPAMFLCGAITAVLVVFIMVGLGWGTGQFTTAIDVPVDGPAQTSTLGTLVASKAYQFVSVRAQSGDFMNKWVDLDYSLVDRNTQRSIDAYGLVEQYNGRDSDGPWREGSYSNVVLFAGVPRGTYDLVVESSAHTWVNPSASAWDGSSSGDTSGWVSPPIHIYFAVKNSGFPWGNFAAFMVLIFGVPGLAAFWDYSQRQRG